MTAGPLSADVLNRLFSFAGAAAGECLLRGWNRMSGMAQVVVASKGLGWRELPLMFGAWWNAALLVASVALLPFARRMILRLNSWIKPMKFEISLIVYSLTLALLFSVLGEDGRWRKQRRRMSWGIGIAAR